MLNKIKVFFFTIIMFFLSYIVPKKNNLLLFQSVIGNDFRENPRYLYQFAKENLKAYDLMWFSNKNSKFKNLKVYNFSLSNWVYILRARYIFIETVDLSFVNLSNLLGRFNIVFTWHGIPIKKIGLDNIKNKNSFKYFFLKFLYSNLNIILTTSPYSKKIFSKAFNSKSIITGYPRNDILFNYDFFSLENLNAKLSLDIYDKVYLYVPTYRESKENVFSDFFLSDLDDYLKNINGIFLIKSHPLEKNNLDSYGIRIKNVTKDVEDLQELLPFVDLLITDYSGVIFDYVLLKRPLLLYTYDYLEYKKKRGTYFDIEKKFPSICFNSEKELLKQIKKRSYKNNISMVKKINDEFNTYKDGNSSKRVFKKLGLI